MTNTEIETSYRGILSLLEEKRLKEAFCKTAELAALLPDEWQITDKLSELESSYRYMIQYMLDGLNDPNRQTFYNSLLLSAYTLADKTVECLLEKESTALYYQKKRYYKTRPEETRQTALDEVDKATGDLSLNSLLNDIDNNPDVQTTLRQKTEQAENEFAEVAEAHFELRKDFIKELPNSVFKQHMKEISLFCVATTESIDDGYCNSINPRLCAQLLGMRLSPDDENEDFCDMGFVRSAAEAQPEKLIFCCCYSALDDEDMSYYRRVWNMNHYEYELCENSDLDHIYEILETLGYEKSDDEEEMAEGTHRLFAIYGAAEDSDDDREDAE